MMLERYLEQSQADYLTYFSPFEEIEPVPPILDKMFRKIPTTMGQAEIETSRRVIPHLLKMFYRKKKLEMYRHAGIMDIDLDVSDIRDLYKEVEPALKREGIVEHNWLHIERTLAIGQQFCRLLAPRNPLLAGSIHGENNSDDPKTQGINRLIKLATILHDVGNLDGKTKHAEAGSAAVYHTLRLLDVSKDVRNLLSAAITLHTKSPLCLFKDGKLLKDVVVLSEDSLLGRKGEDATEILYTVSAILFLADKFEIRGTRLLKNQTDGWMDKIGEQDQNPHYAQGMISDGPFMALLEDTLYLQYTVDPTWILINTQFDLEDEIDENGTDPMIDFMLAQIEKIDDVIYKKGWNSIIAIRFCLNCLNSIPTLSPEERVFMREAEKIDYLATNGTVTFTRLTDLYNLLSTLDVAGGWVSLVMTHLGENNNQIIADIQKVIIELTKKYGKKRKETDPWRESIRNLAASLKTLDMNSTHLYFDLAQEFLKFMPNINTRFQIDKMRKAYYSQFNQAADVLKHLTGNPLRLVIFTNIPHNQIKEDSSAFYDSESKTLRKYMDEQIRSNV